MTWIYSKTVNQWTEIWIFSIKDNLLFIVRPDILYRYHRDQHMYVIFHEHLHVKKICSRWIPHDSTNAEHRLVPIGRRKCLNNYIPVFPNASMISWNLTNHLSPRTVPKVNTSGLHGSFKMSQLRQSWISRNRTGNSLL